MLTNRPLLAAGQIADQYRLEERVQQAFAERLDAEPDYNLQEIDKVCSVDRRLFPEGYDPEFQTFENVRVLCRLSQFELQEAKEISSHRKLLGPVIVLLKKLTWPFIKIHLKGSYDGQSEFNAMMVEVLAESVRKNIDHERLLSGAPSGVACRKAFRQRRNS